MKNPLKTWRQKMDHTQEEAATLCGVNQAQWARWESPTGAVSYGKALKVHEVTGIDLHVLRPDIYKKPAKVEA